MKRKQVVVFTVLWQGRWAGLPHQILCWHNLAEVLTMDLLDA